MSWPHPFELINLGITDTVHQPAGSAIEFDRQALIKLGFRAHRATRVAPAFIALDRTATAQIAAVHKDETAFVSQVKRSITEMEDQFAEDRQRRGLSVEAAWDNRQLHEDTAKAD